MRKRLFVYAFETAGNLEKHHLFQSMYHINQNQTFYSENDITYSRAEPTCLAVWLKLGLLKRICLVWCGGDTNEGENEQQFVIL